ISPTSTGPLGVSAALGGWAAVSEMVDEGCGTGLATRFSSSSGNRRGLVSIEPPQAQRKTSLRRYRLLLTREGGMECVPGQGSTFDAHRKLAHAGKHLKLAKGEAVVCRRLAGEQIVEGLEKRFGLGAGLAFQALRHHRG